ncbi:Brp/Blh family beta-carotene 15,15'-dioxygenase [Sphingomicrobium flavum]|uniref:Brp/Blh family beta-carotene 15,15'-dioxygenase n=1 Tax=Sphingomicrobium flavum TaxID=1229164 RepID=UPI0021AE2C04|nr:Brp/Blh family beta-carotene 15,15'-dioxygenase [Sphingomicrobium flavum]
MKGEGAYAVAALACGLAVAAAEVPSLVPAFILCALGMLHGAVDMRGHRIVLPDAGFVIAYLAIGLVAAITIWLAPLHGLIGFFALSAWHFAREEQARDTPAPAAWGEGLVLIGAVFLLRPQATEALLQSMGTIWPAGATIWLALIGATGFALMLVGRRWTRTALLLGGYALFDPLLGIALHFAMLHAAPRFFELAAASSWPRLFRAAAPFAALAIVGGGLLLGGVAAGAIAPALFTAAALAILIPHMLMDRSLELGRPASPSHLSGTMSARK